MGAPAVVCRRLMEELLLLRTLELPLDEDQGRRIMPMGCAWLSQGESAGYVSFFPVAAVPCFSVLFAPVVRPFLFSAACEGGGEYVC